MISHTILKLQISKMLIHKEIITSEFIYKKYDEDIEHHLIDEIQKERTREDLEFDYIETDSDLVNYIWTVMDDDTDLMIIPVKLVEWSPYDTWYFIY